MHPPRFLAAGCLLAIFVCGAALAADQPPAEADFFVAAGGNDAWSGRLDAPDANQSDGPFATLARARDAVRAAKKNAAAPKPITVLVRGGVYRLAETWTLGPEDSGTEQAPITYAAYPGEQPTFSGGDVIRSWRRRDDGSWGVQLREVAEGKRYFRQLFVDGKRCVPARSPNEGFFRVASLLAPLSDREQARQTDRFKLGFSYRPGDLAAWPDVRDAVVVVYHSWTTSRHHVSALEPEKNVVRFTAPAQWPIGYWEPQPRYYLENVRAALDAPGEWHLDRASGELVYLPRPGEDLERAESIAPRLVELVRLVGDPQAGKFVEHVRLAGLSWRHADWRLGRQEPCDGQAAAFLDTAAIFARGVRNCAIERCEVAHVGGYAVWFERGCRDNRLEQCHLHDLGAGGVRIGAGDLPPQEAWQTSRHEIFNNWIHGGGRVYHAGVGVWIGRSSHNLVHHNEISDLLYTGVSVGWSWGYDPSSANHNRVEFNHIHRLGQEQLSDLGGIYTLGICPGTQLRYNRIHDIRSYSYGGWGIYPDEGTSQMLIENNVVYRTKTGGFHQHYGRENVVRNNVFALADEGQIIRSRNEPHRSFVFERNIIYFDRGSLCGGNWSDGNFLLKGNLYWRTDGAPLVFPGDRSLEQWQAAGQDQGSLFADPRFRDPTKGDFELAGDSPALALGFQPIDTSQIGLAGDASWTSRPAQEPPTGSTAR